MSESFLSILNQMKAEGGQLAVPIDSGGGGQGFVGPLWAGYVYRFMAEINLPEYNKMVGADQGVYPSFSTFAGGWTVLYYYVSPESFAQACSDMKKLNVSRKFPDSIWFTNMGLEEVVNRTDEAKAKFKNPDISASCSTTTWKAKKHRHAHLLIAQPLAVSAVARCYREELGISADVDLSFDISEMSSLRTEEDGKTVLVTDDFYKRLCGDPNELEGYVDSALFKRRCKLWEALGESDGHKYKPFGNGDDSAEEGSILDHILQFLYMTWPKPKWAEFRWVYDPRVDAVNKGGYREQLPGLITLYKSEIDARAAVSSDDSAGQSSASGKAIPAAWIGLEAEWEKNFNEVYAAAKGLPLPKVIEKLETELGITKEEAKAWAK